MAWLWPVDCTFITNVILSPPGKDHLRAFGWRATGVLQHEADAEAAQQSPSSSIPSCAP